MSPSLFPKVIKFFELFEKQSNIVKDAAFILDSIFKDFRDVPAKCEEINKLEIQGDELSREISSQLSLSFITPLDREDIHSINMGQEDVLNAIKSIASRISLYRFGTLKSSAVELVGNLRKIVEETELMLHKLGSKKQTEEHCKKIITITNESEMQLLIALGEIYDSNPLDSKDVLQVLMWNQIYNRIERALNKAGTLANIIEGVSIKNA
ncbi:MAG: DUF47 family protein [Syntrophorhabdus sp.]